VEVGTPDGGCCSVSHSRLEGQGGGGDHTIVMGKYVAMVHGDLVGLDVARVSAPRRTVNSNNAARERGRSRQQMKNEKERLQRGETGCRPRFSLGLNAWRDLRGSDQLRPGIFVNAKSSHSHRPPMETGKKRHSSLSSATRECAAMTLPDCRSMQRQCGAKVVSLSSC
jgi:hypothetical protein